MAEATTAALEENTSAGRGDPWPLARPEFLRVQPVQTRTAAGDLKLKQALATLDNARTWEETRAARERLLALAPDAIPSVIAELAEPQPPDRLDALLELLLRWRTPAELAALARLPGPELRAALAAALGHCIDLGLAAEQMAREQVTFALLELARDADAGVRYAAVEALGLAGLRDDPVLSFLQRVAREDPNEQVKAEARSALAGNT